MKRISNILMLATMALVLVSSCEEKKKGIKGQLSDLVSNVFSSNSEQKEELKEQIEKFNNVCPISLGDIGFIVSVLFNENDDVVEIKFSSNESFAPISVLSDHQNDVKESLCLSLSKESSKKLVDNIIAAGVSVRTVFIGLQTRQRVEFSLTSNELSKAIDKYSNMNDNQKLIVSMYIGSKIKLPLAIDDITKLVGLSLTADALVYKYEINDSEIGQDMDSAISFMKYITLSQIANSMKNGIMGERNRQFYKALIDCNQGVECEYHELQTAKKVSFRISTDEIKEVISGKWDNQPTAQEWEDLGKAMEEFIETYDNSYDNDDEEPTYYEELVEPVEYNLSTSKECYETAKQLRSEGQGSKAIDLYLRAYRIGESPHKSWALHQIGCTYYFGLGGVKNNYAEAFKYFEMASNLGLLPSKYYLGLCYEYGRGVQKDKTKANEYYAKSGYQAPPGYDF